MSARHESRQSWSVVARCLVASLALVLIAVLAPAGFRLARAEGGPPSGSPLPAALAPLAPALVTQQPDLHGCLLADIATSMNLLDLRAGRPPSHTYQEVWNRYNQMVPGFASDPYKYPYPWTAGAIAESYGLYISLARHDFTPADVDAWLGQGAAVIVYQNQGPRNPSHALALLAEDGATARYYDPWYGYREQREADFYAGLAPWVTVLTLAPKPS